jgi:hypothetical protein
LARRRRRACLPPACSGSPRSRYTRPRMGSSTAAVAAETVAAWSLSRIGWPVVVVVGSVVVVVASVVVVVDSVVVVVASVVVVVSCVVVASTVVVGAVTIGWVVVAPNVVSASVVVVRPTAAGVPLGAGWASGAVAGLVGDGVGEVLGWRGGMVVDAEVGADAAGTVEAGPPGGRLGVDGAGSWGPRAAEATKAARTETVRPKANSVSRQGCRGDSRCRGDRLGMLLWFLFGWFFRAWACPPSARRTRPHST